jgi:hypothetical protein
MAETVRGSAALDRRLHAIGNVKLGKAVLTRLAMATVREAKILVPRKTSNLGRSIHATTITETEAHVVASARYAGYVEFGTRPHEITPRAKKALRFAATAAGRRLTGTPRKGAAVVFAKRVHHPGTRPHPFMRPAAEKAIRTAHLADEIVAAWNSGA